MNARPGNTKTAADDPTEAAIAQAFAPLHKAAFGVAIGSTFGLVVTLLTAARLLLDGAGQTDLSLLGQFFAGYEQSWTGALIGGLWGFFTGFIAGWFFAFTRNLVLAIWLMVIRARAELEVTRDFLDHI
jgi:hypothetical protein